MSAYPNTRLDHLNPQNWWPAYDAETDRRAVPAAALVVLDADLNAYVQLEPDDSWGGDRWRHLGGLDQDLRAREVILEWGRTEERKVPPDFFLYIAQRDFEAAGAHLLGQAMQRAFDDLWAFHQAGRCSRLDFDRRAASLRELRDTFLNNKDIYSGKE